MNDKNKKRLPVEQDQQELPTRPIVPICSKCGKTPFKCPTPNDCGMEDL